MPASGRDIAVGARSTTARGLRWRPPGRSPVVQAITSLGRTVRLLAQRRLHLRAARLGTMAQLPDGRRFRVFRESTCDTEGGPRPVTLAVWFHLRGVPPRGRVRQRLFERLCLVNTVLFAGFAGYEVKLWMVDRRSGDYAGLYSWRSAEEAEPYAEYITRVLTPLSVAGSVGSRLLPGTLDDYLLPQDSGPPATEKASARQV